MGRYVAALENIAEACTANATPYDQSAFSAGYAAAHRKIAAYVGAVLSGRHTPANAQPLSALDRERFDLQR